MPPIRILARRIHRRRIVQNVVAHRNKERLVAETGIRPPRMINVKHSRRIKTFAQRTHLSGNRQIAQRSIHINRVICRKRLRQIQSPLCRSRQIRSMHPFKIRRFQNVRLQHRRRNRPIKPSALTRIIHGKAHHHGIRTKNHPRKRLIAPRAFEPDDFRTGRDKTFRVTAVRIRPKPDLRIAPESRRHLERIRITPGIFPRDAIVVIVIPIRRIWARLYIKALPVLKIANGLVPCINKPAIAFRGHFRHRCRSKVGIITRRPAQNMQLIRRFRRIISPRKLNMNRQSRLRRRNQAQQGNAK